LKTEVKEALQVLHKESFDENCPKEIKEIFTPSYVIQAFPTREFEFVCELIGLFTYVQVLNGKTTVKLRPQLVQVLSIYFIHGECNKASRKKIEEMFSINPKLVNSFNHELRNYGYLQRDQMRTGICYLSEDLIQLKDFYNNAYENKKDLNILLKIVHPNT
jgi:hypothetical protein